MKKRKKIPVESREKQRLMQNLTRDYLSGGYVTQHELAVRYGVSDSTVSNCLRCIKAIIKEEFEEQLKDETEKRLAQLELLMGKANRSFETSKQEQVEISTRSEKRRCGRCQGTGRKDGELCQKCEGRGWSEQEVTTRKVSGQAGDPRFLAVTLKAIQEVARIRQLYPEKTTTKIGRQYNVGAVAVGNRLNGVSQELLLQVKRLMLQIEQSAGEVDESNVVDAEFEKTKEE